MKATGPREEQVLERLVENAGAIRTEFELREAAEVIVRIRRLAREKNAVILAHNYQVPEIFHGPADYTGDSLGLAREAKEAEADLIVFCGVHFMAETAKILNPSRTVLLPDLEAGCSLAEAITADDVRALKQAHPGVPVVCYANCSAAVKAESDVCCTSSNAVEIVEKLEGDRVIFVPDDYLARNVARETTKEIVRWPGTCMVHEEFTPMEIEAYRETYPDLYVLAHPECDPAVVDMADYSGSTSAMIGALDHTEAENVLMVTECSMSDNVRAKHPTKNFVSTCQACPHMKKITLAKLERSLEREEFEVDVPESIRVRAKDALERMLEMTS